MTLLSRMNVDEKIAQLGGVWAMQLLEGAKFSTANAQKLISNGIRTDLQGRRRHNADAPRK